MHFKVWFQNRRAKWRRKEVRDREKKKSKTSLNPKMPPPDVINSMNCSADYLKADAQTYTSYNSTISSMFYEQEPMQTHQISSDRPYECSNMLPPLNNFVQANQSDCSHMNFAYPNTMY